MHVRRSDTEVQLLMPGLSDIRGTPLQLGRACVRLRRELDAAPVVRGGFEGSVMDGMAHNAATAGIAIAGAEPVVVVMHVAGADGAALAPLYCARWGRTS